MAMHLPLFAGSIFDPSRLRIVTRGEMLLVMDRISGRWSLLPSEQLVLLKLLAAPAPARSHDEIWRLVAELRDNLVSQGIGVESPASAHDGLTTVIVKLTNACNLACAYCYDFESSEKAQRLETELALRAVEQAIDLCHGKLWIIFHGGEPMLVWSLIRTIVIRAEQYAANKKVTLDFTGQTNMTRVTEEIVEFSLRHRISWGISVDGTQALHDRFRVLHDGRGSHAMFVASLDRFPAFVRSCSVMSTITSANHRYLLRMARYFRDLGMSAWDWSLFQPIGRARGETQFEVDVDELVASWNELFDAVLAGEFDGFPVLPVKKYIDNFVHGPGPNMCMRPECGAARDLLSISSDGTIEACDCIDPLGKLGHLGDLHSDTLASARASDKANLIRSRNVQHQACGQCIWFGVCGGTCLAHAGGTEEVWPLGCAVALNAFDRISLELATGARIQSYLRGLQS